MNKLDNETSRDIEKFIVANDAKFQYTPPDIIIPTQLKVQSKHGKITLSEYRQELHALIAYPTGAKILSKPT